jgi:hypothetical protein
MTDQKTETARIEFIRIEVFDRKPVICLALIDDVIHAGVGDDRQSALEAAFHSAFPGMNKPQYAPAVAWSPHLAGSVPLSKPRGESS